jgi:hypothetical protein
MLSPASDGKVVKKLCCKGKILISKIQDAAIDVVAWPVDEINFYYPEGARSKNAIFPPERVDLPFIIANRRYLYKRSDKRYPDQFWGEVVAYQVGCILGVNVPPAFAAYNSTDGDCGALIEWFYEDGKAAFIPGGLYMQRMIKDFDRKRGQQHNFGSIQVLGRLFSRSDRFDGSWEDGWADACLFDALIGNTDRHQDNWGCLHSGRPGAQRITFAPLFDNGTSLGHERFVDRIAGWKDENYLKYVMKGTHHLRWERDDLESCGHIDMLTRLSGDSPNVRARMQQKIRNFDMQLLVDILERLCALQLSIELTQGRKKLYIKLIDIRRNAIEAALS